MARKGKRRSRKGKYAAIGFVVSKVGMPLARRIIKKKAKAAAKGAAAAPARAAKQNPAKTGVAFGALLGAGAWLASRRRGGDAGDGEG